MNEGILNEGILGALYEYKGETYRVFSLEGIIKDPTSRKWLPAISYVPIKDITIECHRERSEFLDRFVKIKDAD